MDDMKCQCGGEVVCSEDHEHGGQVCTMKCNTCGTEVPAPAPAEPQPQQ